MTTTHANITLWSNSLCAGSFEKECFAFLILAIIVVVTSSIIISHYMTKQKQLIRKQIEDEYRFSELQFKMLRSQLEPHFIFNSLNAIGSSIFQNENKKSYDFLQQFSKLMRITLANADKIYRTLNDEIECVKNYLSLEQFRFEKRFDYQINISKSVDLTSLIPKTIIQSYVENAIKYGLAEMPWKGLMTISITNDEKSLKVEIEDNGTLRKDSKHDFPDAVDHRISLMNEYVSLFNQLNTCKIETQVTNKTDDSGNLAGTSVIIKLPLKSIYNLIPKTDESI